MIENPAKYKILPAEKFFSFLLANRPVSRTVLFPIAVIPNKVNGQQNNSGHDSDNINSIHRKTSFIICLAVAEPGGMVWRYDSTAGRQRKWRKKKLFVKIP